MRLERSLDTALARIPENPSDDEVEAGVPIPLTQTTSEPKGTTDHKAGVMSRSKRRLTTGSAIANPGIHNGEGIGSGLPANEESTAELVASVLRIIKEKETLRRPLRHGRARIKNHQPNEDLAAKFEEHVNDELASHNRLSTFTTKKWLRISTWWLLKVPIHSVPSSVKAALI